MLIIVIILAILNAALAGYVVYMKIKNQKKNLPELSTEEKQKMDQLKKSFESVFNYNKDQAIRRVVK